MGGHNLDKKEKQMGGEPILFPHFQQIAAQLPQGTHLPRSRIPSKIAAKPIPIR